PKISDINRNRDFYFPTGIDELWLIGTDRPQSLLPNGKEIKSIEEDFAKICQWNKSFGDEIIKKIRLFILAKVDDIKSEQAAEQFHDLTLRVVNFAKTQTKQTNGNLYLSLAGGRKTMSADMQDAAYCFGCNAIIHIIGDNVTPKDGEILSGKDAAKIVPIILGATQPNAALYDCEEQSFEDKEIIKFAGQVDFLDKIRAKQKTSQFFYTSYYSEQSNRSNFRILYTLAPEKIEKIKKDIIFGKDSLNKESEMNLLRKLPKCDLHCHLGGVLDVDEMIDVAQCYADEINEVQTKNSKFNSWYTKLQLNKETLGRPNVGWKAIRQALGSQLQVDECLINAAILLSFQNDKAALDNILFGNYTEENNYCQVGIRLYEALGDMQGSALLQTEKAIRKTVQILLKKADDDNIAYLEVRCSPLNYTRCGLTGVQVLHFICEELEQKPHIRKSLLLIASRHSDLKKIEDSVKLVKELNQDYLFQKYFRGFDLVGDEQANKPSDVRPYFEDILKDCRNITIHAGETVQAESIWDAVYSLSAERVGHGLTLKDSPNLLKKFIERRIGIEMCPSSNFQIVGFLDNWIQESKTYPAYPLKEYLDKELMVCVNTDNPGISRTTATSELLKVARMTQGGLSLWNIFQLIYNGLQLAFYPYEEKKQLFKDVETTISELIKNNEI
ncbi:MAG: CRISPR-associated ring nuclease, partial [Caldisericia bacterium]|nr:CRISPR-associated ring nuclease [Caldisericia bacterium]